MWQCEDVEMWKSAIASLLRTSVRMRKCEDVEIRHRFAPSDKCEDVKMWKCKNVEICNLPARPKRSAGG